MITIEFPMKSATYAMKGKQLLNKNGIRAYVGKRSGEDGCFYYLTVKDKDSDAAKRLFEEYDLIK